MKLFSDKKHIGYAIKNIRENKEELSKALEKCDFVEYEFNEENLIVKSNSFKRTIMVNKSDWLFFNEELTDFIAVFPDLYFENNFSEIEDAVLLD